MEHEMEFEVHIPFVEHMGFRLQVWDGGEAVLCYDPAPSHLNSFQVVHGGATMALLDVSLALAARSLQKDVGAVTLEMKTSFLRAAQGPLKAHGKLLHRTATLAFCQGEVTDAQGHLCAHATGTFKFMRRLATGPRSLKSLVAQGGTPDD
jgi:uncharacterized protein (TIGR00369 family)